MAKWRNEKPTIAQLNLLERWGIIPETGMTRGELADLINTEKASRQNEYEYDDDYCGDVSYEYDHEIDYIPRKWDR